MTHAYPLEIVVDDAIFGESPRWYGGALWFSDIGANKVWRLTPDGQRQLVVSSVQMPSGLGWTQSGELLVASIHDSAVYRMDSDGSVRQFAAVRTLGAIGTNDMATVGSRSYVSCAGRVYQTGDTIEQISAPVGSVVMIDHETGLARKVADGYRMPNGIVVTPDGARLIFSELWASRLLQFNIAADGSLTNETVFALLDGHADGICIDNGGAVWVATGGGERNAWQRIEAGGRVLEVIPAIEGYNAIACWLGGEDGRDLYLVANAMNDPSDIYTGKARSRVLRTRVKIPGPQF